MDTLEMVVQIVLYIGPVIVLLMCWEIHKGNEAMRRARLSSPALESSEGEPPNPPDDRRCVTPDGGVLKVVTVELEFQTGSERKVRRFACSAVVTPFQENPTDL